MNSEIPPIPESDNVNLEPVEPANEEQTAKLEDSNDVWTDSQDLDRNDTDIVDVNFESQSTESSTIEDEFLTPVSDLELETSPNKDSDTSDSAENQLESKLEASKNEPELFADSWLDESEANNSLADALNLEPQATSLTNDSEIEILEERKNKLKSEIETLQAQKEQMLLEQIAKAQANIAVIVEEGTKELIERKTALQIEIEKLERRKERINQEMRRNFAGSSQELAVRVQGFKDYLVGSLQDLATAADKLELGSKAAPPARSRERNRVDPKREERGRVSRRDRERDRDRGQSDRRSRNNPPESAATQFSEPTFAEQGRRIRQLLDKYRNSPDYYGTPWQLRRTFEATHAKRVQDWFFTQGGRGAVDSMGSRLQNILVASAAISVLHNLYGDRCRVLVLTDTPENLGEWRRGLQDCLGLPRSSFGANRGVVLFDSPEVLIQGAERLIKDKLLPVIIVDETEELLNLSVLKFPLWLAFASTNKPTSSNYLY